MNCTVCEVYLNKSVTLKTVRLFQKGEFQNFQKMQNSQKQNLRRIPEAISLCPGALTHLVQKQTLLTLSSQNTWVRPQLAPGPLKLLQSWRGWGGGVHDKLLQKGLPPFCLWRFPHTHTHLLGSKCPPPEERRLSMPETGEKERNCLFKSYTDLE